MKNAIANTQVVDWLMEGDPAIQWQTMRDVLGMPASKWKPVREQVAKEGWGQRLLSLRDPGGTWGGGIYTPKWTSTNYTMLLLRDMGLPRESKAGAESAKVIIDRDLGSLEGRNFASHLAMFDLCVKGMYLALLAYFDVRDARVEVLVEQVLREQMDDGGWNCKRRLHDAHHSSLHTTINVLDGLADYAEYRGKKAAAVVAEPMRRAHEFMLAHRLFRSDKTGKVIREAFTKFSFPPRWHYDVLRALDHLRRMDIRDERLADAIELLESKRGPDGRWKLENHHRGIEFFKLEKPGWPSRWNTLRALRVLRWWE
jgi:hypothetical protein